MTRFLMEVFRVIVVVGAVGSLLVLAAGVFGVATSRGSALWHYSAMTLVLGGVSGLVSAGFAATLLHIADRLDALTAPQAPAAPAAPAPRIEPKLRG